MPPPSQRPLSGDPRRQLFLLKFVVGFLIAVALALLVLPLPVPKPLRILVAASDLVAAATIWLLGRQRIQA